MQPPPPLPRSPGPALLAARLIRPHRTESHPYPSLSPRTGAAAPAGTRRISSARAMDSGSTIGVAPVPDVFVVVPAGTGTTALFLARHAPRRCRVLAVPCVGSSEYLRCQMRDLDLASGGADLGPRAHGRHQQGDATLPHILSPPPRYSVPFGSVSPELLRSWRHARAQGVLLDLVYGPVAWAALRAHRWRHRRSFSVRGGMAREEKGSTGVQRDDAATDAVDAEPPPVAPPTWLYIHTGGHEGLPSQLRRYARAGLLRAGEEDEVAAEVRDIWKRQGSRRA